MNNRLTQEEIAAMFGNTMPMDVVMTLENWDPERLTELREMLEIRASAHRYSMHQDKKTPVWYPTCESADTKRIE